MKKIIFFFYEIQNEQSRIFFSPPITQFIKKIILSIFVALNYNRIFISQKCLMLQMCNVRTIYNIEGICEWLKDKNKLFPVQKLVKFFLILHAETIKVYNKILQLVLKSSKMYYQE